MKQTSKKIIETAAEVLNRHVSRQTPSGVFLAGNDRNVVLGIVNELLSEAAEGGRLVAAVESNGDLLGFVPRMNVPIPELDGPNPPPPGPDNAP
jgi:hypothetical protein